MQPSLRLACFAALLAVGLTARADSTSSASSAGSASSGSISTSLGGSSDSSTGGKKAADGAYTIVDVGQAPDRARTRVTMVGDTADKRIVLDLPAATFAQQQLGKGDMVYAQNRVYGIEFARNDTRQAFFLVLADAWYDELAARPVI